MNVRAYDDTKVHVYGLHKWPGGDGRYPIDKIHRTNAPVDCWVCLKRLAKQEAK